MGELRFACIDSPDTDFLSADVYDGCVWVSTTTNYITCAVKLSPEDALTLARAINKRFGEAPKTDREAAYERARRVAGSGASVSDVFRVLEYLDS